MTANPRMPTASAATASAATASPTALRTTRPLTLLPCPPLAPSGAPAAVTARVGGVSSGPYATLNLSLSVGDDPALVLENRRRLGGGLSRRPGGVVFRAPGAGGRGP